MILSQSDAIRTFVFFFFCVCVCVCVFTFLANESHSKYELEINMKGEFETITNTKAYKKNLLLNCTSCSLFYGVQKSPTLATRGEQTFFSDRVSSFYSSSSLT